MCFSCVFHMFFTCLQKNVFFLYKTCVVQACLSHVYANMCFSCINHIFFRHILDLVYFSRCYICVNRLQCVNIDGVKSTERNLACGVPQGLVFGPPLFFSYTFRVGDVVRKHGLTHHVYANDKDIYIAFKPKPEDVNRVLQITDNCLTDLCTWFAQNFLQLNDEKTIFMLICSKFKLLPDISYIQVGEVEITPSAKLKVLLLMSI